MEGVECLPELPLGCELDAPVVLGQDALHGHSYSRQGVVTPQLIAERGGMWQCLHLELCEGVGVNKELLQWLEV